MSFAIAHPEALATAAGHLKRCWIGTSRAECGRGGYDNGVCPQPPPTRDQP
jgi:hypothetical protein